MTTPTTTRAKTTDADLLGIRLAHRAMIRDATRLANRLRVLTGDKASLQVSEAGPIRQYLRLLTNSIHHHHTMEDTLVWPMIVAAAGEHADLSGLSEDHSVLDPMLDGLNLTAAKLSRSAAAVRELANGLADLRDLLIEHIGEEEETIFPLITRYVAQEDWKATERTVRKGARLSFELPRALDVARPEERERIISEGGLTITLVRPFVVRAYRKLERAIFPPTPERSH